jgi:hypothetical protein
MNTLISNPDGARLVARQVIDQRVRDAEQRRFARAARAERRTQDNPHGTHTTAPSLPWWGLRFLRPAH